MANEHVGARREIAFTKETARGTKIAPSSGDWIPNAGFDFRPQVVKVEENSALGHIAMRNRADVVQEFSQGTVNMRLYDNFLTPLNVLIFGAAGTVDGDVTTYAVANTNLHSSYTISTADPVAGDLQYALGMLNSCSVAASTDDYVNLTLDVVAAKEESASLTPAYTTTALPYHAGQITVKYATNFAGLGAGTALKVKNLNLNFEKNVEQDYYLGSTEPDNAYNQRMSISGDMTVVYNATTLKTLGLASTSKSLQITIANDAFDWDIIFPSVDFGDWNTTTDVDGYVQETVGFFANYVDKTNGLVQATVTDNS